MEHSEGFGPLEALLDCNNPLQNYYPQLSVYQVLSLVPEEQIVATCMSCQNHRDTDVREAALRFLQDLPLEIIWSNFYKLLIDGNNASNPLLRRACQDCLNRLSSEQLAYKLATIFEALENRSGLLRFYAESLLDKIESKDMADWFPLLQKRFLTMQINGDFDSRRASKKALLTAMKDWTVIKALPYEQFLKDCQTVNDQEILEHINYWLIMIMLEKYSQVDLINSLEFFKKNLLANNLDTKEVAALAILRVVSKFSLEKLQLEIECLWLIIQVGEKDLRRQARKLALWALENQADKNYLPYWELLLDCQMSKNWRLRKRAATLLLAIPLSAWETCIQDLLNKHEYEWKYVSRITSRILKGLEPDLIGPIRLIEAQRSISTNHCLFAARLASQISLNRLKEDEVAIYSYRQSKQIRVAQLAEKLWKKINKRSA